MGQLRYDGRYHLQEANRISTASLAQTYLCRIHTHSALCASQNRRDRPTLWFSHRLPCRRLGRALKMMAFALVSQSDQQLSCSVTLEKKGNPFWGRPFLVELPPKKKKGTNGATEQLRQKPRRALRGPVDSSPEVFGRVRRWTPPPRRC